MLLQNKERQEVAKIGKQELIDRLLEKFPIEQATTTLGPGHDAAVISPTEPHLLTASKLMIENIHFDLTYFPLKHLGYKAVAATATAPELPKVTTSDNGKVLKVAEGKWTVGTDEIQA